MINILDTITRTHTNDSSHSTYVWATES